MKLSINTKLLILFLLTIVVSLLVNSSIYFTNLKDDYLNDFYKQSELDIEIVNENIKDYENKLKLISDSISMEKEIKSILNLVSNYQNKDNYNTILFDEEKKKLLLLLDSKINTAENFSYEILDKDHEPIAINRLENTKTYRGIFTYKNKKIQFLELKTNKLLDFSYKCKVYFDDIKKNNFLFYFQENNFSLRYVTPIYNQNNLVGYFVIKKHFKDENIYRLLKNISNKFTFIFNDTAIGNIKDIDIKFIKENAQDFEKDANHKNELFENKNFYYHAHYLKSLKDEKLYFVSAFDKQLLNDKIDELLLQLFISIIIATAISFSLISLYLKNRIFNRINRLISAIEQIKKKNYVTIETKEDDEIDKVAIELNNLTKEIKANFKTIENLNDFLQRVLDTVPVRIFWKDLDSKFLGANRLFLKDCNLKSMDELVGKTDYDMHWSKNESKLYIEDDQEVIKSKKPKLLIEETQTTKDGQEMVLMTSKVPLLDKDKNIIGILGVYDDITTMKKTQEELKEKTSIMFEQSKMAAMGEMLESIAHQWRQPLSIISTSASGIKMQKEYGLLTDEQLIHNLDTIVISVKHLSQTIEDFRGFYEREKEPKSFDIKICLEKTIELISSKLKNREINIVLSGINIETKGFENELIQVFMNIINNTKDAFDEIKLERKLLIIDVKRVDSNIVISFQDNATGIPIKILPKVFEHKFTTKQDKNGTGIGLYMSRLIINKAMGKIAVLNKEFEYENRRYKGACFIITLPLKH